MNIQIHRSVADDAATPAQAHFEFGTIDGTEYLRESYGLRYDVYCHEQGFLPPGDYPDMLETDAYDEHAIHIGGVSPDGALVGTVRLVLPSARGLPLFDHCQLFAEYRHLADPDHPVRQTAAEISRLAMPKSCRRRSHDGLYDLSSRPDAASSGHAANRMPHRRHRPELVLGLYKAMYQASKRHGITHWLAAMESPLARLLRRYQFDFKPIGPELDYYGPVAPYIGEIAEIERTVHQRCPALLRDFVRGLERELVPAIAMDQ